MEFSTSASKIYYCGISGLFGKGFRLPEDKPEDTPEDPPEDTPGTI